jgi:hypothetical protein
MSFPTHCHLDGGLFLFRVANPKGDVPSNLGYWKEKDQEIKAQKVKVGFPFTDYHQEDSQREDKPQDRHLFARQGNNKTKTCSRGQYFIN